MIPQSLIFKVDFLITSIPIHIKLYNLINNIINILRYFPNEETEIVNLNKRVADLVTGSNTLQSALTATETKRDAYLAELNLRPGTTPTTPIVAVDPIAVTNSIVVDEINEEAKKYRTS